jgi:crotonobetaine/carnitine-CoA ligase
LTRTIPALFRQAVDDAPDRTWLAGPDTSTYSEAMDGIERAASALRAIGLDRGDRVLVTARTTPEYLLTWLALMEVGAVQVPVNPKSTPAELAGFVRQATPRCVVTDDDLVPLVEDAIADAGTGGGLVDVGELFTAAPDGRGPAAVDERDVAVMIPTSGTTGRSKLVMQTHLAYVMAGEGFPYWLQLGGDDRLMTSLPLFHINAPAYSTLGSIAARASLVLLPAFSAHDFIPAARRYGATEFNAIGAMLEILMRQPERPDDADNPLRLCYAGPAPDKERHLQIERRFGIKIVVGYAMSESPYGLIWRHGTRPYGTLGSVRQHPYLGTINEAKVVAPADPDGGPAAASGTALAPGDTGEILLRNPVITPGYWGMPEETAAVKTPDGWLHTGDLVSVNDDETYTFVGRRKEVLRRRGENLSPLEVEEVLDLHPAVLESAVVGVASDLTEEEIKAFIVLVPGTEVDMAELRVYAAERLSAFKVPRFWQLIDALPRTPTARIAKHQLPAGHQAAEYDAEAG